MNKKKKIILIAVGLLFLLILLSLISWYFNQKVRVTTVLKDVSLVKVVGDNAIYYDQGGFENNQRKIKIINIKTKKGDVYASKDFNSLTKIFWSPDNKKMLYKNNDERGIYRIYNIESKKEDKIEGLIADPFWGANSLNIYYYKLVNNNSLLMEYNLLSKQESEKAEICDFCISGTAVDSGNVLVSELGTEIEDINLYNINLKTGIVKKFTDGAGTTSAKTSKDGRYLAFGRIESESKYRLLILDQKTQEVIDTGIDSANATPGVFSEDNKYFYIPVATPQPDSVFEEFNPRGSKLFRFDLNKRESLELINTSLLIENLQLGEKGRIFFNNETTLFEVKIPLRLR